jgi:hypothetical protein
MNAQYEQYLQWIGLGCTAIVGLCLVIAALLHSRPRRIRAWALIAVAVLEAVAAYLLISMSGTTLSMVWMAALGLVGLALGWFTGRMTKTAVKDAREWRRARAFHVDPDGRPAARVRDVPRGRSSSSRTGSRRPSGVRRN